MYKVIKVSGVGVDNLEFLYTTGASLAYTSSQLSGDANVTYELNGSLHESFRAFFQNYVVKNIARATSLTDDQIGELSTEFNIDDQVTVTLLQNLHGYLGIEEKELYDVYRNSRFLELVDYYESKALEKGYSLDDQDMFRIFRLIELAFEEAYEKASKADVVEIIQQYWPYIYEVLEKKKTSEKDSRQVLYMEPQPQAIFIS